MYRWSVGVERSMQLHKSHKLSSHIIELDPCCVVDYGSDAIKRLELARSERDLERIRDLVRRTDDRHRLTRVSVECLGFEQSSSEGYVRFHHAN